MAKRASQPFVTALDPVGKAVFTKDQIVPDAIAKRVPELVYDDGAPEPAKAKKSADA